MASVVATRTMSELAVVLTRTKLDLVSIYVHVHIDMSNPISLQSVMVWMASARYNLDCCFLLLYDRLYSIGLQNNAYTS